MRVAIVGGGLVGVLTALTLAERGVACDLFEAEAAPLSRASWWNEGKIHLGLTYARAARPQTVATILEGAGRFYDLVARWVETAALDAMVTEPFDYAAPRESLLSSGALEAHFTCVAEASAALGLSGYLGRPLGEVWRRAPPSAWNGDYDEASVQSVWRTAERAVDTWRLSRTLRAIIAVAPRIVIRAGARIEAIESRADDRFALALSNRREGPYDHVVNCTWFDRLRLDRTAGLEPPRPWSHRLKLAVCLDARSCARPPRSLTLVSGSFGDATTYPDRRLYLSWYPAAMVHMSEALAPPAKAGFAFDAEEKRTAFASAIGRYAPYLREAAQAAPLMAAGGDWIFAWGRTDIADPKSGLHRRDRIGVTTAGRLHSVNTGKYATAPLFAEQVAARIAPQRRGAGA